jgi:hypothetical protein
LTDCSHFVGVSVAAPSPEYVRQFESTVPSRSSETIGDQVTSRAREGAAVAVDLRRRKIS